MNDRIVHILHFYADSLSQPQLMNDRAVHKLQTFHTLYIVLLFAALIAVAYA